MHQGRIAATEEQQEFIVAIRAQSPETDWGKVGSECSLLRLTVDGRYDQHIFLVGGPSERDYAVLVGPLAKGEHLLELAWDRSWRPELGARPKIVAVSHRPVDRSSKVNEPIFRTPILYLRPDTIGRFSDLPLAFYYDVEPGDLSAKQMTYTVILTNEDGGTNTERLMARWGRTTDIEWFYAYDRMAGKLREIIQGPDHKTLPFRGAYEGTHPLIYDATDNNNFVDSPLPGATVRVRLAPVAGELHGRARETVMDRLPWTYAVTAAEMRREGRIEEPGDPATPAVSDQRNYLCFEVCAAQNGTELYFDSTLRNNPKRFTSDHNDPKARINRSGCFRSTIELPAGTPPREVAELRIHVAAAPPEKGKKPVPHPAARILSVPTAFMLNQDYSPGKPVLNRKIGRNLRPGESVTLGIR